MADLLDGLARHLQAQGLVAYDPDVAGGDCFFEHMPPEPDECVVLTLYGGPEPDSQSGYSDPRLQVRTRGTPHDRRTSWNRSVAIFNELEGLGEIDLPDGTQLFLCYALQAVPASMGVDENGRHEHSCNYQLSVGALTKHRV
ncbi:minor capsid protein [Streptomyces sp.]|uniref:minor capsid protein n=1 Tax=Streptomyces sp. TaxID=1931 RepID=UPI002D76DC0A|nr:minor capsid protein [Streptomyces sp.]HET6356096.1 minor capsid protein [Streptomyces sp.]